jgi:hypothetical protein
LDITLFGSGDGTFLCLLVIVLRKFNLPDFGFPRLWHPL